MGLSSYELRTTGLTTLISTAQASELDNTPAMNEIIRRFEPLTRRLSYGLTTSFRHLQDDVANAARSALVRAVRRHDNARLGFAGYAKRFMSGAALRELKRWQPRTGAPVLLSVDDQADEPSVENFQDAVIDGIAPWGDGVVAATMAALSPEQGQIAKLRYVDDKPLDELAALTGTTPSAVSQRLGTIHRTVDRAFAA